MSSDELKGENFLKLYELKKQHFKKKLLSDVETMTDDLFDFVLHGITSMINIDDPNLQNGKSSGSIEVIDLDCVDDDQTILNSSESNCNYSATSQSSSVLQIADQPTLKRAKFDSPAISKFNGCNEFASYLTPSSSQSSLSSDHVDTNNSSFSSNLALMELSSQKNSAKEIESIFKNKNFEKPIDEEVLKKEMEVNKAMFCIFMDGNQFFLCDVQESRSKKNVFYKVYNVASCRLYKTFNSLSEFIQFLLRPIKHNRILQPDRRVLVAWNPDEDRLRTATIIEVYNQYKMVEVLCDSGEKRVVNFDDICLLPVDIPVIDWQLPVSASSGKYNLLHQESTVEKIYNNYSKHNHIENSKELDGIWRWSTLLLDKTQLLETSDNEYVTASTFNSVWRNDRINFKVGDDVLIWDDYKSEFVQTYMSLLYLNDSLILMQNPAFPLLAR